MTLIYKICPAGLWREAQGAGAFAGSPIDLADGFVHLSTAAQVAETAEKHFHGVPDLLLVAVDQAALGDALRYEASRGGAPFPHLYGPLPVSAARSVEPIGLAPDGVPRMPFSPVDPEASFDPGAHGWEPGDDRGFMGLVGSLWERPEAGGRACGFLAEARHLNRGGIVHGGMLMAFADDALGRISVRANPGRRQATIQLDTHFVSAAREGEFVEARSRIVRQTRAINFLAGTLTVGDRIVATANGVWTVMAPRPPAT